MSAFSGGKFRGAMALRREVKHLEAQERQAAFDREVHFCQYEQNVTEPEARRVVNATRRMDYRKAQRKAAAR